MKTALVLVDIQHDYFPGGKWELVGMDLASLNAARLLAAFREQDFPIFHVQHIAKNPEAPFFVEGTHGAEIHESVQPQENEKIIIKEFGNSFRETNLLEHLHDAGVERLVICGGMSNMCIDATTRAANDLGFECIVAHDACAASNLEFYGHFTPALEVHCSFMAALAFAYAKVVSTNEAIALALKV
ncbi:cysteine hydrolase family protein [Nodularia harveyana UHCC-0300]|uniref:Cysteine hydrolase family protein n=1 Tax=Nodularia harveyana UHCC-0300 TaxID=2974287 RepID=A0ABU5UFS9_9CYAN|nr:cysteine hydrolase family protein [Nodularia harveyana]MEA5582377.1 cysteine hydrolase family protein [Nodularia harveyana UHCC-0300]